MRRVLVILGGIVGLFVLGLVAQMCVVTTEAADAFSASLKADGASQWTLRMWSAAMLPLLIVQAAVFLGALVAFIVGFVRAWDWAMDWGG